MIVGKAVPRVDAYDKVTGRAKYVDDYFHSDFLVAKVLHSTIANGLVKKNRYKRCGKNPRRG